MTDAPGWPDPQRPGVPANPERDGAHALDDHGDELVLLWRHGWWIGPLGASSKPHELAARRARYLGPCHTPADLAALVAAGQEAMREAGAKKADLYGEHAIGGRIRETPLPSAPEALARIRAEARREGMEAAAVALERRARSCRPTPSYEAKEPTHYAESVAVADELEHQAAAIRTAAKEGKP